VQPSPRSKISANDKRNILKLLIFGEEVRTKGKKFFVRYPSYAEIAHRFRVSTSTIGRYSKEYDCLSKRKEQEQRAQQIALERVTEERASRYMSSFDYLIELVERGFEQWEVALETNQMRIDSVTDLMTLLKARLILHKIKTSESNPKDQDKSPEEIAFQIIADAHRGLHLEDCDDI